MIVVLGLLLAHHLFVFILLTMGRIDTCTLISNSEGDQKLSVHAMMNYFDSIVSVFCNHFASLEIGECYHSHKIGFSIKII